MIFDQAIAQSCGFCLQGGVQVFSAEGLERRFESGVQQIVISDSVASASLLNRATLEKFWFASEMEIKVFVSIVILGTSLRLFSIVYINLRINTT